MENASKALIIAGAILLAILLISLGIMIYNQAQSVVDGSGMTEAELSTFNSKFTKYEGTQKGSVVKSMINEVLSNNANDAGKTIEINVNGATNANQTELRAGNTSSISNNQQYKITFGRSNGRINSVTIANPNSNP